MSPIAVPQAIACANGFEAMHVSHTMWALSSLVPQGGEQQLVVALCQRALTTMDNFKAMELPSMLVGIARLGVTNETLVEGLATQAALHAKDMGAQGLSNTSVPHQHQSIISTEFNHQH